MFQKQKFDLSFINQTDLLLLASLLSAFGLLLGRSSLGGPLQNLVFLLATGLVVFRLPQSINAAFWGSIALVIAANLLRQWEHVDNHLFLFLYWIVSVAIIAGATDKRSRDAAVLFACRWWLVFVMGFAVLQKTVSGSYLSGEFFFTQFIVDNRFYNFLDFLGIDLQAVKNARVSILAKAHSTFPDAVPAPVQDVPRLWLIVQLVTWWDYLVQLAICILFAVGGRRADNFGHLALLSFVITTYVVAPVYLFGWLLCMWGMILAYGSRLILVAGIYWVSLVLVVLYTLPWKKMIQQIVQIIF